MELLQNIYGRRLMAGLFVSSGLLLMGCESNSTVTSLVTPPTVSAPATVETPPEPVAEPQPEVKDGRMALCQSELASLKAISPKAYEARKAHFNSLVKTASVYSAVRNDVSTQTKDTLDALYKYKTNQVCAEIGRDVLNGLIRRGESVK